MSHPRSRPPAANYQMVKRRTPKPAAETLATNYAVLDLKAYWLACREGGALPNFSPLDKGGKVTKRTISRRSQRQIIRSPLSSDLIALRDGLDILIVQDIRRRALLERQLEDEGETGTGQ